MCKYDINSIYFAGNKSRQPQHMIFTKHITRSLPEKTQAVCKQRAHLWPEHRGVIINLCKAIFLITGTCVNTMIIKFVLLTTNHCNLNLQSSQYILLNHFRGKKKHAGSV